MKKRLWSVLVMVALIITLLPAKTARAEATEGNFTYEEVDGNIVITGLSEAGAEATELVIPAEINDVPITEIANYAFSNNQNIVKVTLPDTLKVIGGGAFAHCYGLTTINLPEGLERIGGSAFAICNSITSLHIPASVTSIGNQAFTGLHGLTEFTVAEDNEVYTAIDGILYSKDLTVLHVATAAYPSDAYEVLTTVTTIADSAFANNAKITNVTMYENVTSIGSGAFGGSGIGSLYIPKSVTEIGDSAFVRMPALTEFYLDAENPSFTYENGLLTTKDGTRILDQVMNKDSLTELVIPDEVTTIDPNAFYGCSNLAKVTIPASVTSIGYLVCYECAENLVFVVTEGSAAETYAKENNFAYEYEATQKDSEWKAYYSWSEVEGGIRLDGVTQEAYALTELVIPTVIEGKNVVEIAPGIFSGMIQLESLSCEAENDYYVVENGVVYTADYKTLHSVTGAYPESSYEVRWGVEEIGAMAFWGCDLPVIKLNSLVTTIGSKAFAESTVTSIYLPENVQYIAEGAFYGLHHLDYTTQFIAFSVDSNNPYFEINNGRLISKDGTRVLLQTHDKDLTSATLSSKVTTIDDWAFLGCENLTDIKIPASVTSIGKKSFADCTNLVITTPEGSYAAEYAKEQGIVCEEISISDDAEGVAVNEENFPDDIFRAYVLDTFDTDWNNVLSEEEIAAATIIDCMHVGIKDITGIEYLTELMDLQISMNEIWMMDLSSNTKLQNIGVSYQEPSTGEIKGEIGQEGTAFLTEFTFPYENLFDYEDQLGAAGLYVKVSLPEEIYTTPEDVYWYYRRESFGFGGDLTMQDAEGNYYYQLDVRDSADYLYVGTATAGLWELEDAVVDLSALSEEYYIELVTFDEFTTEWTEENGKLVTAEPVALEGTKVFFKNIPVKVETKVTNEYTVDFRQIVGEENIDKVKTVENGYRNNRVEVVDGIATFYPLNYGVHQITPQLCASYEYDTGLNGYTVYVNFRFERLVSVEDCEEVPEGLGDQFESVDDLKDHMHKEMHKDDKKQHKHQEIYDAKLWDIDENCAWYNIAPEDFPAEGVEVFIPYPTGTDRNTDFKIAHIFEHDCNGFKKGDIEYPKVVKEEDGIRFRVYGLSPVMLAYGEEDAEEEEEITPVLPPMPEYDRETIEACLYSYEYYALANEDVAVALGYDADKLYEHWINYGIAEGRSASLVFHAAYYLEVNPDVAAIVGNDYAAAYEHFVTSGLLEGRESSPVFDVKYYLRTNTDVAEAFEYDYVKAANHFNTNALAEGRSGSGNFDYTVYRYCNTDVAVLYGDETRGYYIHYINHGRAEGRTAGFGTSEEIVIDTTAVSYRIFDAEYYLENYPVLERTVGTSEEDLYRYWLSEGISLGHVASPVFDPEEYLEINTDVADAVGSDLEAATNHFLNYGIYEGRTGVYEFDYTVYKYCNTDVVEVFGDDIVGYYFHYVKYGRAEGRTAKLN